MAGDGQERSGRGVSPLTETPPRMILLSDELCSIARFSLVASQPMGAIHVCVFARHDIVAAISNVKTSFVPCGIGNVMYNKVRPIIHLFIRVNESNHLLWCTGSGWCVYEMLRYIGSLHMCTSSGEQGKGNINCHCSISVVC